MGMKVCPEHRGFQLLLFQAVASRDRLRGAKGPSDEQIRNIVSDSASRTLPTPLSSMICGPLLGAPDRVTLSCCFPRSGSGPV